MKLPCVKVSKGPRGSTSLHCPSGRLAPVALGTSLGRKARACATTAAVLRAKFLLRVTKAPSMEEPTALALPWSLGFGELG